MTHPFFDSVTFPWDLPEAQALHRLLSESYKSPGHIELIRSACGGNVGLIAVGPPDEMWRQVFNAVAVAGRLKELDMQLRGLNAPAVTRALDKLCDLVEKVLEPGVGERIFINRVKLRAALRQLAAPNTPKQILVVRGESKSGKSWTRHIIEHYAKTLGQGCTYLCSGLVTTVEEALDFIFAELGGTKPDRLTTEDAWFRKAAADMLKLAGDRKQGSWIVMDDLGTGADGVPLVDPLIRRLFDQLAFSMQNPAFARWFRVVLIAYPDGNLPSKWKPYSLEDRTTLADVQPATLSEFLLGWARFNSKALDSQSATGLAQDILARANAANAGDDRAHFERVHDELSSALEKL